MNIQSEISKDPIGDEKTLFVINLTSSNDVQSKDIDEMNPLTRSEHENRDNSESKTSPATTSRPEQTSFETEANRTVDKSGFSSANNLFA